MKRIITAAVVSEEFRAGKRRIVAPPADTIIEPDAWTRALELGVAIDRTAARPGAPPTDEGGCDRVVDPSGLIVVRGRSVRLGKFSGAGADRHVGLTDLVTGRDGSPMTAGIMSWGRDDSFPWTLDYDEVDLVLEGVLQITIDGRLLEGRTGDVFYIPKGSRVLFGTPNRTRVFYVTYPADWAGAGSPTPT